MPKWQSSCLALCSSHVSLCSLANHVNFQRMRSHASEKLFSDQIEKHALKMGQLATAQAQRDPKVLSKQHRPSILKVGFLTWSFPIHLLPNLCTVYIYSDNTPYAFVFLPSDTFSNTCVTFSDCRMCMFKYLVKIPVLFCPSWTSKASASSQLKL